jgi:hypothetical protein
MQPVAGMRHTPTILFSPTTVGRMSSVDWLGERPFLRSLIAGHWASFFDSPLFDPLEAWSIPLGRPSSRQASRGHGLLDMITAETSLIALNSLQGRKKFPVRMRRELAHKKLISCPFSLFPRRRQASNRAKFPVFSQLAGNLAFQRRVRSSNGAGASRSCSGY